ncbi:hypothetical protein Goshw_010203 [Gossypium schwendimanii]|uniref:Uncharacterized protein n=2 Tax=Gossypium schwendimanii TaxID=34291 RepID=A0A7J9N7C3_GOSSC|nr:hypothetical protein [Gossypium schwendimanii]
MNFLIKWRIMRLSKLGLRQYSGKEVIVWPKDMYQSCGTSLVLVWTNICFVPLPSFRILLTVVSLLEEVIWYLQWRSTWLYSVARRFKQIEFTRELSMS